MEHKVIEGTWDEVTRRAGEFTGHRVRITVLDELETPTKSVSQEELAEETFRQQLLAMGLVSQFPIHPDGDDDDSPITVAGEPISEAILRERR